MKAKFLIVVLATLVLATGTVWAQKGRHNRRAEHKELTTEQVAKKMANRMKEDLSLTDEQASQVYPICLEQAQVMREHRAGRREMAEKSREAMAQQCERMAGRMKAVLTPEQYARWDGWRQCPDRKSCCAKPACRKGDAKPGHHRRTCNGVPCVDKKTGGKSK